MLLSSSLCLTLSNYLLSLSLKNKTHRSCSSSWFLIIYVPCPPPSFPLSPTPWRPPPFPLRSSLHQFSASLFHAQAIPRLLIPTLSSFPSHLFPSAQGWFLPKSDSLLINNVQETGCFYNTDIAQPALKLSFVSPGKEREKKNKKKEKKKRGRG